MPPEIDSFIGAEGGGRKTIGGRNGAVVHVENLNNDGAGSFRAAIAGNTPKMVNFKVSGRANLGLSNSGSNFALVGDNTSIMGQTSPNGFTVSGRGISIVNRNQVIVRHLASRTGYVFPRDTQALTCYWSQNVVVANCSFSWANDEVMNMYAVKNGTTQYNIMSEALHNADHADGSPHGLMHIYGGDNCTVHHNLIMHGWLRFPLLANFQLYPDEKLEQYFGNSDWRNNVVYNWGQRTGNGGSGSTNIVNNYYKPGPATPANRSFMQINLSIINEDQFEKFYINGNVLEGAPQFDSDNWLNVRSNNNTNTARILEAKRDTPFPLNEGLFDQNHTALQAYNDVLAKAGARRYQGLDAIDIRLINEVTNGTATFSGSITQLPGIIDRESDVGGWVTVSNPNPPFSTMNDGIPDAWKQAHGLDINVNYGLDGDIIDQPFSFDTDSMSPTYGYRWFEIYCMDIAGDLASITPPEEFTLTVTAGDNGTVNTSGGDFAPSTSVFLQAFPASGFRLLRWERLTGDTWTQISTATSFNFLMPSQNTQVRALFTPISQGNRFFARKKQNI